MHLDRSMKRGRDNQRENLSRERGERLVNPIERIRRVKVQLSRNDDILVQAKKIFLTDYRTGSPELKIEFTGEAGTGMGPTLEFYALVAKALQRTDLRYAFYM